MKKKEKEKKSQNSEMIAKTYFNFTELSYEKFENKSDLNFIVLLITRHFNADDW